MHTQAATRDLKAPATLFPPETFLLDLALSVPDSFKTHPNNWSLTHVLNESHVHESHTLTSSPFSTITLFYLQWIYLQASPPANHCTINLLPTTQNHVIGIREATQSPFSLHPRESHSLLSILQESHVLFHYSICIYIEQSRRHDTPLSHSAIYLPFTLTQAELSTCMFLFHSKVYYQHHTFSALATKLPY